MHFRSSTELGVPGQKAWDVFKTFSRIHDWHPATENTILLVGRDDEPLAVREFQIKGGGFVISELLSYSEADMQFSYRIIKTDLPLRHYVAQMRVTDHDAGGSTVEWEATFESPHLEAATDDQKQQTLGLVQMVVESGLENIARLSTP